MTEELLRKEIALAAWYAFNMGRTHPIGSDCDMAVRVLAEHAIQRVFPVVEAMVQEALEQGFNGRADAEPPPCG